MKPTEADSVQVCTEIANQVQRVFECRTVEQDIFLPRTYVIIAVILLSTILVLWMQHKYFSKFDLD